MEDRKITSFTDIRAWQEGHKLALQVYRLASDFPQHEIYGLASQLKRAASSVTSNIAEGFGRSSPKDREHFYVIASGSLNEVKSQLLLARDLQYFSEDSFEEIAKQANIAHKLLNALIKTHRASGKSNV